MVKVVGEYSAHWIVEVGKDTQIVVKSACSSQPYRTKQSAEKNSPKAVVPSEGDHSTS